MTLELHGVFSNSVEQEEGVVFAPKFDEKGLMTAVVTDAQNNEILMVAYMNAETLKLSLETGIAHYWSRSRSKIWKKGETSGNLQKIKEMRTDCDQDALWLKVEVEGYGATCHTGQYSCFYRSVEVEGESVKLVRDEEARLLNPKNVYKLS